MGDKLPELSGRDTKAFLDAFADDWEYAGGSKITGKGRKGRFSLDVQHKTQGIRRDYLKRVLNAMGVTREEFFTWYRGR